MTLKRWHTKQSEADYGGEEEQQTPRGRSQCNLEKNRVDVKLQMAFLLLDLPNQISATHALSVEFN